MEQTSIRKDADQTTKPTSWLQLVASIAMFAFGIFGIYSYLQRAPQNSIADEVQIVIPTFDQFRGKRNPDMVLVLSGQMRGYMNPCGCSEPQIGGLIRRYELVEMLKKKGWNPIGIDLGELPQISAYGIREQDLLKYQYSMKILDKTGYRAVGIGKHEMELPLEDALAQYSLQFPRPTAMAFSIADASDPNSLLAKMNLKPFEVLAGSNPKIGVVNLIGPDLADAMTEKMKPAWRFYPNNKTALPTALNDFADKGTEFNICLYHEYPKNDYPALAVNGEKFILDKVEKCATYWNQTAANFKRLSPLNLVVYASEIDEPPGVLQQIPGSNTYMASLGHKGKYVGVLGVYREKDGFEYAYQLVQLGPVFEPAKGAAPSAAMKLMEEYTSRVKALNLMDKMPRTPHPRAVQTRALLKLENTPTYVGSSRCGDCHEREYQIWSDHGDKKKKIPGHAIAFDTLTDPTLKPGNRQFDPECIVCHTVGFRHNTGYHDAPPGRNQAKLNQDLVHVGCESCHGPGSQHARNPNDARLYPLINEFRPSDEELLADPGQKKIMEAGRHRRMEEQMCRKCHDSENDVNWFAVGFQKKWFQGGVVHNDPARQMARIAELMKNQKNAPAVVAPPADDKK